MRRVAIVGLALGVLILPASAARLTSGQRKAMISQAVQLLGPKTAAPTSSRGVFRVRAEHYYDNAKSSYIPVRKISVHEYRNWASQRTEWNTGRADEFEFRLSTAEVGKYYQVRVEWEDGSSYTWEYQMPAGGTTVRIEEPR